MKKRIVIFIGSLTGGGAERVACNLANYLFLHDYDVEILTMSDVADNYIPNPGVKRSSLIKAEERKNRIFDAILRYRRLGKYMEQEKVDCYVVMLPITIAMMLLQKKKTKAKILVSERNNPESYSRFIQFVQKSLCKKADGYVFQTEEAMTWYNKNLKNTKTIVIPNAINPDFLRAPYMGERKKTIVGIGRLKAQKNFPLLIHAFQRISADFPEYDLVIYGEGEKRKDLENLVIELNLLGRVSFLGSISNIAETMEDKSLFVLSSNFEGMPNALIEAMALGLPCISTDCPCGGPRYLIKDGENGVLVPVGDVDAMANAMKKLLENEDIRTTTGNNARAIQTRLSPEKIYGQWESFIRYVVE